MKGLFIAFGFLVNSLQPPHIAGVWKAKWFMREIETKSSEHQHLSDTTDITLILNANHTGKIIYTSPIHVFNFKYLLIDQNKKIKLFPLSKKYQPSIYAISVYRHVLKLSTYPPAKPYQEDVDILDGLSFKRQR